MVVRLDSRLGANFDSAPFPKSIISEGGRAPSPSVPSVVVVKGLIGFLGVHLAIIT